jgi:SAM-dependent methyltransferase
MLPKAPWELRSSIGSEYQEGYEKAFHQKYSDDTQSLAWASEERVPKTWSLMRHRQVEFVRSLITQGDSCGHGVLCDISAGAGYYTLACADLFRLTLHCDLSVGNLSYTRRKAASLGIRNIFFVRMDYFIPPFCNSLDCLLCMDTLIHGEAHEFRLLATITNSLNADGFAILDFHNWWHNPLRRLGLMPNNFGENRSYTKREINQLLESRRIAQSGCFRFHQELNGIGVGHHVLRRMLPATRFLVRIRGNNSTNFVSA